MKNIYASALAIVAAASLNGASVSFTAKDCEVVIAPDAPKTVRYAADELRNFLGKTLGGEVPVCTKITEGRPSIVLGTNEWSRAAGLAPEKLPRDGYCIKTVQDRVYIAGCDDPSIDMASMVDGYFKGTKKHYYERGTYFGVIEFLERFAGVRFYFPGELGTVIQPKLRISVPDIDITDSPDFTIRFFSGSRLAFGVWFEPITSGDFGTMMNLFKYRLRFETEHVSCCHGQFRGWYPERFAKTHPEYIRMNEKGDRPVFRMQEGKTTCNASQLCQSSDVWEEIYKDAKAFFEGKPASARAIPRKKGNEAKWGSMAGEDSRGKWFDVMPNDAFAPCYCEKCQAEYDKNDTCDYATELVWRRTVELANRLKAEGVKGRLTQMAYRPYRKVPSIDIPDNVDVMVSESGPWSVASPWKLKRDNAEIESWYRKLGRKVWLWNYVLKHGKRNIPGLPALAPHAYGTYYKSVREWVCGAYAESNMDRFFMNALNLYVFAKVCWDLDTDVEALIEEHHRLMFGAAAPEMAKLYGLLEEKWTKGVVGKFEDGPRGPFLSVPPESELRAKVYTKEFVAELDALIAAASAKVAPGSLEARRIDVVRSEFRDGVARFAGVEVPEVKRAEYPDRWVHVRNDLSSDARLNHFGRVIARAAESGYNGVMWDAGVGGEGIDFDGWKGDRLARLEKAKAICREKGIEIIPMVWSVGRAHALLNHDPTLAECQPVRGVPYRANGGKAEFDAGNAAVMKDIFGGPVTVCASGKRSRPVNIKVKPFRRYRLTAHAVQKGFKSTKGEGVNKVPVRNAFSISATPLKNGQNLNTRETVVGVSVADGESDLVLEFLSLDFDEETISVGVNYRAEAGEVTFTDVNVVEVGIRRPIIREGAPFVVRDAATGVTYEPGKDYVLPKSDASAPGPKDKDVAILLPQGSAIRSGASLVVDAYEPSRRRDVQVGACMANPALYAYFEKSAPVIYELFGHPKKWFLSMDEIRAGGMCGACEASGKDLAHLLADCLAHQRDAIRKVCPDATVYAWCDMYDPFVNAKPHKNGYAMCKGNFVSNEMIAPKDIVAVVWGGKESAPKSLEYFSSRGVPTLYATFYDVHSPDNFRVRGAAETANKAPGCRGLMYTTWVKNGKYDLLGVFGDFMKCYSNPMPAREPIVFTPGNSEVVIEAKASRVVEFAAEEATNFLSRALGAPVPIVREPTPGRTSLVLGVNSWSKEAGIDPSRYPRDTFIIRTHGGKVFVVGVDGNANPRRASVMSYERGTMLGTYAFLEDYVGCRFYFPGELGEVVPKSREIAIPEINRIVTPEFLIRKYYNGDGEWFAGEKAKSYGKTLNWLRVRASTTSIPCCHGTAYMKFVERFSKTHPEYFALRKDGSRCHTFTGSKSSRNGYLCFSSGIRDEIVEECVRRFKEGKKYVDIMPNDALPRCLCEKCEAAYSKTDPQCYASELIWDYTRYVANKLIERGVPGIVTQMAYAQYRRIPDFDIPTNVYVMVAESGPWSLTNPKELERQYAEIRAWKAKIGHPVWIWTYPHKYGATNIPGLPDVAPRAWGEYFKALSGDIIGTFAESETDQWIYHYLNYYVFSRVMWDSRTDIDAVLDEHHSLMFGAAARKMKQFYEILERKWVNGIVGCISDTDAGPVTTPPTELEIWTKVYGPDTIGQLDSLLKAAAKEVAPDSIEAKRIAFFRKEYFDRLVAGARLNAEKRRNIEALRWKAGSSEPIYLSPFKVRKGREPEEFVKTAVTIERTATDIVVRYDCEDNRMDDVAVADRKHDDFNVWQDAGLEIVLNPSADMKTYYHVLVNLNGNISDEKGVRLGSRKSQRDVSWESGAKVQIEKRADGWKATVSIPLSSLGEIKDAFPAEFARNRVTRSGKGHCLYNWSPYAFGFNSLTEAGTVVLK